MNAKFYKCITSIKFSFYVIHIHFEQTKDNLLVKSLHGPSMVVDRSILVSVLLSIQLLSVFWKQLIIGQFIFLCFILFTIWIAKLPERTETDQITGSDKTMLVVNSCNSCLICHFLWSRLASYI